MALTTLAFYLLYFDDPALGAAAVALNGGSITLDLSPEQALGLAPGGVILQLANPFFSGVPSAIDLGGYTPVFGTPGTQHTPRYFSTGPPSTDVHEVTYDAALNIQTDVIVTHKWAGSINFTHLPITATPDPVSGVPVTGKFELQVVTWTGDGAADRLIPTSFPLNTGVVAIWGCGGAGVVGTSEVNFFRHNGPGMLGTALMGITNAPQLTAGIMAFEPAGFRVSAGSFVAPFANTLNVPYVAVVLRDTTSDRRYLRCGTYTNHAGGNFGASCAPNSGLISFVSGGVWTPALNGLLVQDTNNVIYRFSYISAAQAGISPTFQGVGGVVGFTFIHDSPHSIQT